MANYPIELVRSASASITLTLKDNDNVAINLTGATVIFAVKNKKATLEDWDADSSTAKIKITNTVHSLPLQGKTVIELSNDDTDLKPGQYVYGVKVIPASGENMPSGIAPFIINPRGVEGE